MKYTYYIIGFIFLLTLSCNVKSKRKSPAIVANSVLSNDTLNDKYEVLNDFLTKRIKNKSKAVIIFSEKINTNTTLKWLLHNDIYAVDSVNFQFKNRDVEIFNDFDWETARKKYSKNFTANDIKTKKYNIGSCCWLPENFKYKNLIFEELSTNSIEYMKKYMIQTEDYEYYSFSEPVFYKNNTYLVFSFEHGFVRTITSLTTNLIIYKKHNGKWILSHIGNPDFIS